MIAVMSGPWFLVLLAAAAGGLVLLRGSRFVGGALLVGAALVALGVADVSLPSTSAPTAGDHDRAHGRGPWVLRVTLDETAPGALSGQLSDRWVDLPGVGSARADGQGRIVLRGERDAGYVQMSAVKRALAEVPHVASVERID